MMVVVLIVITIGPISCFGTMGSHRRSVSTKKVRWDPIVHTRVQVTDGGRMLQWNLQCIVPIVRLKTDW